MQKSLLQAVHQVATNEMGTVATNEMGKVATNEMGKTRPVTSNN
jgi:hypothetical protein